MAGKGPTTIAEIWARIPVLIRAVTVGLVVGFVGTVPWARLIAANAHYWPKVPWAVLAMAPILVAWWLYFAKGRGAPKGTADARRLGGRANRVPEHLWGPALGAGMLGLFATLLLQGVLGRLVTLPQQQDLDPSQYPVPTVLVWVLMSSVVAGVVEETASGLHAGWDRAASRADAGNPRHGRCFRPEPLRTP